MKNTPIDKTKRYILLDTNIISSLGNDSLGEKILDIVREVVAEGFEIAISDITYYELLTETSSKKEVEVFEVLNEVTRFYCKIQELIAAARIGSFYKDHGLQVLQFNLGDRIIAATSILHNCIILTKNGRDFPQPFFKEIDRRMLEYTSKQYPVCVPVYFLEPQLDYIGSYHEKRKDEIKKS